MHLCRKFLFSFVPMKRKVSGQVLLSCKICDDSGTILHFSRLMHQINFSFLNLGEI